MKTLMKIALLCSYTSCMTVLAKENHAQANSPIKILMLALAKSRLNKLDMLNPIVVDGTTDDTQTNKHKP